MYWQCSGQCWRGIAPNIVHIRGEWRLSCHWTNQNSIAVVGVVVVVAVVVVVVVVVVVFCYIFPIDRTGCNGNNSISSRYNRLVK